MKYNRLKRSYNVFMRGKDGKNLEERIIKKFEQIDRIARITKKNEESIRKINKKIKKNYQKVGIIRYDAFQEMGGNLSFALTMLDEEDGY
jgi:C-terminal processing protease CtpA/Prc